MIRGRNAVVPLVPIHADTNVGPHDIAAALKAKNLDPMKSLFVHSVFYTIQGEGPYAGVPAVFVRLAGCNLGSKTSSGCEGCDTAFQMSKGTAMTFAQLTRKIVEAVPAWCADAYFRHSRFVVFTGGEPGLQLPAIFGWCKASRSYADNEGKKPFQVQMETNGFGLDKNRLAALLPTAANALDYVDLFDVVYSPKATSKGYSENNFLDILDALKRAKEEIAWPSDFYVKFVLDADSDSLHHEIPHKMLEASKAAAMQTYVSPMTEYEAKPSPKASVWTDGEIDRAATARNYHHAANYALRSGVRVSVQMHTFLAVE